MLEIYCQSVVPNFHTHTCSGWWITGDFHFHFLFCTFWYIIPIFQATHYYVGTNGVTLKKIIHIHQFLTPLLTQPPGFITVSLGALEGGLCEFLTQSFPVHKLHPFYFCLESSTSLYLSSLWHLEDIHDHPKKNTNLREAKLLFVLERT